MTDLAALRGRIDEVDERIIGGLAERFAICREVAAVKATSGVPMMQPGRVSWVRTHYVEHGRELGIPSEFAAALVDLLIAATCALEDEIIAAAASEAPR
jgi:chorismate mutase